MAESPMRLKDIFLQALELSAPEERETFLSQMCGKDEAMRRQIDALLQAHGVSDSFLEKPGAVLGLTADASTHFPGPAAIPGADVGTRIGPYKLREQIGEGGMGVVYVAEQQEPVRRMVALKIIKPGMDSAQVLARFEAERQALALMDHPNIAKVLDAGTTAEGRPYFVMELVKGVPITQYCDERRLSLRQRLELFIPVCQAVQHAHQKAIIHRDLKPSNVLIALYDGKPVPKVIDFGVAKAMGEQLTEKSIYTGFGAVVGTLAYMSPEQAELNQIDIDTRSDIYSLGVMLYELLTGSTPIERQRLKEGAILEVLRLIREEEPPRPSTRISTANTLVTLSEQRQTEPAKLAILLRGDIDWIVMKALDKDRARRYETAVEFSQDIERFLKDEPVEASPPSAAYRLRKFVKRNRGAVTAAALVLMALLVGIAGTTLGLLEARKGRDGAERARLDEQKERERAEKAEKKIGEQLTEVLDTKGQLTIALAKAEKSASDERDARLLVDQEKTQREKELDRAEHLLYVSQFKEAFHHYEKNDFVNCRLALDECRWDLRGPEYGYLVKQMERRGRRLFGPRCNGQMLLSRDGKRLFTGNRMDYAVSEWDAETGAFVRSLHTDAYFCRSLAMSHDGKRLFAGFGASIVAWDLDTGKQAFKMGWGSLSSGFTALAASADGKWLYAGSNYSLKMTSAWNLEERKEVMAFPGQNTVEYLVASRDGKRLFAGGHDGIKVWDLDAGKEAFKLKYPKDDARTVHGLVLSADGKTLFSQNPTDVVLWNADTGEEMRRWRGDEKFNAGLGVSKDGKQLSTANNDGTITVWNVETGKATHRFRGHTYRVPSQAFSPDGRRLYSAGDDNLWMWDLQAKHESFVYQGHKTAISSLVQDASGKRLVSTDGTGTILVWDRDTGKIVSTLKDKDYVNNLALSRDGKRVYTALHDAKVIKAWDVDQAKELFTLTGHDNLIRGLAVSPDGKTLYSGSDDKTIKAWDLDTRKVIYTFREHVAPIQNLVLSQDGQLLVSSSQQGAILSADAKTGKNARAYQTTQAVGPLALTNDGKRLVYGSNFSTIYVLDLVTGREVQSFRGQIPSGGLALSKDDRRLFSASSHDGTFRIWDMTSAREIVNVSLGGLFVTMMLPTQDGTQLLCGRGNGDIEAWDLAPAYEGRTVRYSHGATFTGLAASPDGKHLFAAAYDKAIRRFDLTTGKENLAMFGHKDAIHSLSLSPDGRTLYSASRDKTVRAWDLAAGKEIRTLLTNDKDVSAITPSHDGHRLFFADTIIKELDLTTGRVLRTLPGHPLGFVGYLGLSPDQKRLVSAAADNTIKVWDLTTNKETHSLRGAIPPTLSKDGRYLAYFELSEQSIKILDLDSGKVAMTLSGQGHRLAMSADGNRVFAGDNNGVITIWDRSTGKAIRQLHGHTSEILKLVVSADGKSLHSAAYDSIKVWSLEERR